MSFLDVCVVVVVVDVDVVDVCPFLTLSLGLGLFLGLLGLLGCFLAVSWRGAGECVC